MSQEDSSPLRMSGTQSSGKGSADRRPLQFWKAYNVWWSQILEQTGKRPGSEDITRWYLAEAEAVWGSEKPSLQETRTHAKCLRTVTAARDYFKDYRHKKKHEHTGSEDDDDGDEDIVYRRGSTPPSATAATELDAVLHSRSRRPSRDSGTPVHSPGVDVSRGGGCSSFLEPQDSSSWQAVAYSQAGRGQSSRGGRTSRGRGRGRGQGRKSNSVEPVEYEIHPGALGPDGMMDAAFEAARAPLPALQPQQQQQLLPAHTQQVHQQVHHGHSRPGMQPFGLPGAQAGAAAAAAPPGVGGWSQVPQVPWLGAPGAGQEHAANASSNGIPCSNPGLSGGSFLQPAAAPVSGVPVIKVENGLDLSYSTPWVHEQHVPQHAPVMQQQQQQHQHQQPHSSLPAAPSAVATGNMVMKQEMVETPAAFAAGVPRHVHMQGLSEADGAPAMVPGSAAASAGIKQEAGLLPMPQHFLAQFTSPPHKQQEQQRQSQPVPAAGAHLQQQLQSASQPLLPSAFNGQGAGLQQQHQHQLKIQPLQLPPQQMQQPAPEEQQQQQDTFQHDLYQLHQQFRQAGADPTPRGFPGTLLFSDNTNLGCDDIIPPPPLFSSAHLGVPPAGFCGAGDHGVQQQQQRGMAGASVAAAVGSSVAHNSAGILSELEAIKGPAMAGLVDAHCAGQQQRISVSALLDSGPFGPAARRLSQGLDPLAFPHQRLSLYAMGSDALGDLLLGDLGDLDAFLGATTAGPAAAGPVSLNEPLQLPRISEGGCGAMAQPSAGQNVLRWNNGDPWHSSALGSAAFHAGHSAAVAGPSDPAAANHCSATHPAAVGHSNHFNGPPAGLCLNLASPRLGGTGGLMSPPGVGNTAATAATAATAHGPGGMYGGVPAGPSTGRKRARGSSCQIPAGLMLDVSCAKRPRVSGLLMDMDTPKVRAMAAGAGITALTPRSPAVTPNRIAALAAAFAQAAATARAAAAGSSDAAAAKDSEAGKPPLQRPAPGSHKFVLDLGDPPSLRGAQAQQHQQSVLPGPAFHQLFSSTAACGSTGAPEGVISGPALEDKAGEPAAVGSRTAGKVCVLNLSDEPTPTALGKAAALLATAAAPGAAAAVRAASGNSGVETPSKTLLDLPAKHSEGFLPPLHDMTR